MGSVFCQEYVSPRRFISTRAPAGPSGSVSGRRNPPKGPFRLGKHEVQKKNTDETRVFWGAEPKALPRAENQKGGRRSSCVHHAHGLGRADGLGRRVHHDRSDRRAARRCRCKCRQQRPGCCHQQIRERRSAHASAPPYRTAAFTATAATSTTVAVVTADTASAVSANSSADEDLTADQDGTYDVAMQDVARKLRATGLTPAEALAAASLASRPCKSAQPCDVCSAKLRGDAAPKRKCSCDSGITVQRDVRRDIAKERTGQFAVWTRAHSAMCNGLDDGPNTCFGVEDTFRTKFLTVQLSVDRLNEFLRSQQFACALAKNPVGIHNIVGPEPCSVTCPFVRSLAAPLSTSPCSAPGFPRSPTLCRRYWIE